MAIFKRIFLGENQLRNNLYYPDKNIVLVLSRAGRQRLKGIMAIFYSFTRKSIKK